MYRTPFGVRYIFIIRSFELLGREHRRGVSEPSALALFANVNVALEVKDVKDDHADYQCYQYDGQQDPERAAALGSAACGRGCGRHFGSRRGLGCCRRNGGSRGRRRFTDGLGSRLNGRGLGCSLLNRSCLNGRGLGYSLLSRSCLNGCGLGCSLLNRSCLNGCGLGCSLLNRSCLNGRGLGRSLLNGSRLNGCGLGCSLLNRSRLNRCGLRRGPGWCIVKVIEGGGGEGFLWGGLLGRRSAYRRGCCNSRSAAEAEFSAVLKLRAAFGTDDRHSYSFLSYPKILSITSPQICQPTPLFITMRVRLAVLPSEVNSISSS